MRIIERSLSDRLAYHGERIAYRIGGLPITLLALLVPADLTAQSIIRKAYARHYWHPRDLGEWFDLGAALCIWPIVLLLAVSWFTLRNASAIRRREGRPILGQILDQVRLFFTAGILPPWYYIFSLHRRRTAQEARSFLHRCETKEGVYQLLEAQTAPTSPLRDKAAFAEHCRRYRIPAVPVLAVAREGRIDGLAAADGLPPIDLFIKPVAGCGGKGAERWDYIGERQYRHTSGSVASGVAILDRLRRESMDLPRLIQPRARNHPAIADLSNGTLNTVRALTCLDEMGEPELIGAVFRMAVGDNRTVDNFHAGGIAAGIDVASGIMGAASNLGMDSRTGWLDCHPDNGIRIAGRVFPYWGEMCELSRRAHKAFADRLYIGWDIGLTEDGPRLVEGNHGPDLDIMQRASGQGLANGRFGEVLAYHLLGCGPSAADAVP